MSSISIKTASLEYLGHKYFLLIFVLVILLHLTAVLGLGMMPSIRVIDIPVRALNIRLGDSDVQQTQEEEAMAASSEANSKQLESAIEKLVRDQTPEKVVKKVTPPPLPKIKESKDISEAPSKTPTINDKISSPRQFVRAMPAEKAEDKGEGISLGNSTDSKAAIKTRYEQTISLWIQKFKLYPELAKAEGMEGDAVVRIRIDRRGNIRYSILEVDTGYEELDRAALDMVRRANPVPAVPDSYPEGDMFEFLIPVKFQMQ